MKMTIMKKEDDYNEERGFIFTLPLEQQACHTGSVEVCTDMESADTERAESRRSAVFVRMLKQGEPMKQNLGLWS